MSKKPVRHQWQLHPTLIWAFAKGTARTGYTGNGELRYQNRKLYVKVDEEKSVALSVFLKGPTKAATGNYICFAVTHKHYRTDTGVKRPMAFIRAFDVPDSRVKHSMVRNALEGRGYEVHYTCDPGGTAQDNIELAPSALKWVTTSAKLSRLPSQTRDKLAFANRLLDGINMFLVVRKTDKRVEFSDKDIARLTVATFRLSRHPI
ncbi:MAG: hypothetical protein JW395_3346 [Nitrospira sp.]|nr:hypothetical protein [Nitrospira sp.]